MFKFIQRILCFILVITIAFFAISLLYGGEKFRWFGEKAEEAGTLIKKKCNILADEIDKIRGRSEFAEKTVEKVKKSIDTITGTDESGNKNE